MELKKLLTKMIRYSKRQKAATINSHKPKLSQYSLSRHNLWLKIQKMARLIIQSRTSRKIFPELCRLTQHLENLRKRTNTWQVYSKVKQIRETNRLFSLQRILYWLKSDCKRNPTRIFHSIISPTACAPMPALKQSAFKQLQGVELTIQRAIRVVVIQ